VLRGRVVWGKRVMSEEVEWRVTVRARRTGESEGRRKGVRVRRIEVVK